MAGAEADGPARTSTGFLRDEDHAGARQIRLLALPSRIAFRLSLLSRILGRFGRLTRCGRGFLRDRRRLGERTRPSCLGRRRGLGRRRFNRNRFALTGVSLR